MTDDPHTITGTFSALIREKGAIFVALAVLKHYWKPFLGTLSVTLALGSILQQGRDAQLKLDQIQATQAVQAAQNVQVNERLTRLEAQWGTLFSAAHINVVPDDPPPPAAAARRTPKKGQ